MICTPDTEKVNVLQCVSYFSLLLIRFYVLRYLRLSFSQTLVIFTMLHSIICQKIVILTFIV
jgi:hypothetical protein